MKYTQATDGDWIRPVRKNYRLMCCDCGLVHDMDFRLLKSGGNRHTIQFRPRRNKRATAAARRNRSD